MRSHWSNRWAFIMATAGSAVGLGNIWKFPYMAGTSGGSAFVLVYLLCVALIGLPLMMTEVMLGRRAQKNPVDGMAHLAAEAGATQVWKGIGYLGIAAGILILSFYSVVAGWVLAYGMRAAAGGFAGMAADQAQQQFAAFLGNPVELLLWHSVFMFLTMAVVARGVTSGLERANRIMMPGLMIILLILLGYSLAVGDIRRSLEFMFRPDFSSITPAAVLSAMGHSFFTLSLGMGAVMVYGSYLQRHVSIARASFYIVLTDTAIALVAGVTIFAIVFANGMEPAAGPGLIFQTLPIAFGQMPAGTLFATLFFVLVAFAAWTSSISLVEPAVSWLVENTRFRRRQAALLVGGTIWLLGLAVLLSFNVWSEIKLFGLTIFEQLDKLTTNVMLPLGGLLMALFAVWVMRAAHAQEELALNDRHYRRWLFVTRYVAPAAIVLVFLNLAGWLPFV
ncbi:sodium-dependent transporter [Betaproteobacteria bacterium SCN2]|jgi:NSS family neurotransmitter:Na+ symporter|nr:sodium-dependent transporter [Betaproteobacteria bacterium SCN2]